VVVTAAAMTATLLTSYAPRAWVVVPDPGEELVAGLRWFAMDEELGAATVTGIGSFEGMVVAGPATASGHRRCLQVDDPVDLVTMAGTVAVDSCGRPDLYATVVASRGDHTVIGGRLVQAHAGPVLELVVREEPAHLCRRIDDRTGLPLLIERQIPRNLRVANDPGNGVALQPPITTGQGPTRQGHRR